MLSSRMAVDEVCEHTQIARDTLSVLSTFSRTHLGPSRGHSWPSFCVRSARICQPRFKKRDQVQEPLIRLLLTGPRPAETASMSMRLSFRGTRVPWTSRTVGLHNWVIQSAAALYAVPSLEVVHFSETPFDLSPKLSYRILQIYICNLLQSIAASCRPVILQLQP